MMEEKGVKCPQCKEENYQVRGFIMGGGPSLVVGSSVTSNDDKSPETFQVYYKCSKGHEWKENRKRQ